MTRPQVAHQLDIEVMEKAHKEVTEDQEGQSSATILQMQSLETGMSSHGTQA